MDGLIMLIFLKKILRKLLLNIYLFISKYNISLNIIRGLDVRLLFIIIMNSYQ